MSKFRCWFPWLNLALVVLIIAGCAASWKKGGKKEPSSFVRTMEPSWASVESQESVKYEDAWASVIDLLVKKFDLEILSKENGYVRTAWLYTWTGVLREDYRVRVTAKFSQDRSKVEIKSEANYRTGEGWIIGSDTALLRTLKQDIMGLIGRVTR